MSKKQIKVKSDKDLMSADLSMDDLKTKVKDIMVRSFNGQISNPGFKGVASHLGRLEDTQENRALCLKIINRLESIADEGKWSKMDTTPKEPEVVTIPKQPEWLMTPKFIHQGPIVDVKRISTDNIKEALTPSIYSPFIDDDGIHLRTLKSRFELTKTYGTEVDRHLGMFSEEYTANGAVSLILLGQKGSGKTMTAEALCNYLLDQGVPVIYMDADIPGPVLHNLIRDIGKCTLFIDEFDKRYNDNNDKERLLTMFSDASLDNVSFIIAGNEKYRFSNFILDRPSRFKYLIEFKGISPYIIEEMCAARGITKECTSLIMRYACAHQASFDVVNQVILLAQKVGSDIDRLIHDTCYINVPKFSDFDVDIVNIRSDKGMVTGLRVRQDDNGYTLNVIHEDGGENELTLKEITNENFVDRKFEIDSFIFNFRIKDDMYTIEDTLTATKRFTAKDVTRVSINPGRYKTFELKSDDGEGTKIVTRDEYNRKYAEQDDVPWNTPSKNTQFDLTKIRGS